MGPWRSLAVREQRRYLPCTAIAQNCDTKAPNENKPPTTNEIPRARESPLKKMSAIPATMHHIKSGAGGSAGSANELWQMDAADGFLLAGRQPCQGADRYR
jgi:hypothetical protein